MKLTTLTGHPKPTLGTFSKGVQGSVSINYNRSGGTDCDTGCPHHPESTAPNATHACYAVVVENRGDRVNVQTKLTRHARQGASYVTNRALLELQRIRARGVPIPWVRLSTNGSLPRPSKVTRSFRGSLRALLRWLEREGIPVHIPVETARKAAFYRRIIGSLAVVRESCVSMRRFMQCKAACSLTVGSTKQSRRERVQYARHVAKTRTQETGRKTIVCPAVVVSFLHRNQPERLAKAKCGNCKACAQSHIDVVYPLH